MGRHGDSLPPTLPSRVLEVTQGHACMLSSTEGHQHSHKQLPLDSGGTEDTLECWPFGQTFWEVDHKGLRIRLQSLEKGIPVP